MNKLPLPETSVKFSAIFLDIWPLFSSHGLMG